MAPHFKRVNVILLYFLIIPCPNTWFRTWVVNSKSMPRWRTTEKESYKSSLQIWLLIKQYQHRLKTSACYTLIKLSRLVTFSTRYFICIQWYIDITFAYMSILYRFRCTVNLYVLLLLMLVAMPWSMLSYVETHHYIIFFVPSLHSKPGMESYCWPSTDQSSR